jgi:hypothetical protein
MPGRRQMQPMGRRTWIEVLLRLGLEPNGKGQPEWRTRSRAQNLNVHCGPCRTDWTAHAESKTAKDLDRRLTGRLPELESLVFFTLSGHIVGCGMNPGRVGLIYGIAGWAGTSSQMGRGPT